MLLRLKQLKFARPYAHASINRLQPQALHHYTYTRSLAGFGKSASIQSHFEPRLYSYTSVKGTKCAQHTIRFCHLSTDSSNNATQNDTPDNDVNSSYFTDEQEQILKEFADKLPQDGKPRLLISWKCANCKHQTTKACLKQTYYNGLVLMRCDDCRKWQLMSDHMQWFKDDAFKIEEMLENDKMLDVQNAIQNIIKQNQKNADTDTDTDTDTTAKPDLEHIQWSNE